MNPGSGINPVRIAKGRRWRLALVGLLLLALSGLWAYDSLYVPSRYDCQPPVVRLEGDFCGLPLSGWRVLLWMGGVVVQWLADLSSGEAGMWESGTELLRLALVSLLLVLPLLPIFSTLWLLRAGEPRSQPRVQALLLGLGLGVALLAGVVNSPARFWWLWGAWLYAGVAALALLLEVRLSLGGRGSGLPEEAVTENPRTG